MNEIIKVLPNFKKYNDYIESVKNNTNPIMLSGLTDSGKVHFAYSTYFYAQKPILIITYNELQAKKILKNLEYFKENTYYFPKKEIMVYDYIAESKDNLNDRINTLNSIYEKKAKIIVTTAEAISQKIISPEVLYKNILEIKLGDKLDIENIKEKLVSLGYTRQDMVENQSEFSIRGGIIDISVSNKKGYRIELWGEEVDSIRTFNINTQRSEDKEDKIRIFPAHEYLLDKKLEDVLKNISDEKDKEEIQEGNYLTKIDKYFNEFYEKTNNTFLDYLEKDTIIFLDEISKIKARLDNIYKDNQNLIKNLVEKKKQIPQILEKTDDYITFVERLDKLQTIYLENKDICFVDKKSMHAKRNGYSFSYREVNFFRSSMDLLFEELQKAVIAEKTVILLGGSLDNCMKLGETLTQREIPHQFVDNNKDVTPGVVYVAQGVISAGFEVFDFNLLIISGEELFTPPKKRKPVSSAFKQGETVVFADLKPRRLHRS